MDWKLFMCVVMTCTFLFFYKNANAQFLSRYNITLHLADVKDGTSVYLLNGKGNQAEGKFRNGECILTGSDSLPGTPVFVKLEAFSDMLQVMTDKDVAIHVAGNFSDWPHVSVSGPAVQMEYENFMTNIQQPFSAEYRHYIGVIRKVTGSERKMEWKKKILQLQGRDSLDMAIAEQRYENATLRYQKQTLEWIFLNPQSYFTPELIMRWCPRTAWKNAFRMLSPESRNSFYGARLKAAIE